MSQSVLDRSAFSARGNEREQAGLVPIFCKVMFGVSLGLCILRIPFLLMSVNEEMGGGMGYDPAFKVTAIPALAASFGIVFCGGLGNILLLMRVRWGLFLAAGMVLAATVSIGVDVWVAQISRSLPDYRGGMFHNVMDVGVVLMRSTLLLLYVAALWMFWRGLRRCEAAHPVSSHE